MTDAERLRAFLADHGMSQRGTAKLLGIDERTMRRYCLGECPVPPVVWLALESVSRQ
jgi:transcriptional regulator with XRE-family HTH domain